MKSENTIKGKVTILLKRPNEKEKRRSFSLVKRTPNPSGKPTYEKLSSPILDQINKLYDLNTQTFDQLNKQAEDLRDRLYREHNGLPGSIVFNQENLSLLGDFHNPAPGTYWKDVYGRKKKHLVDMRAPYYYLRRAIEAVGNLSLLTASENELQDQIDGLGLPDNKQRKIISSLQPVLDFIGRKDVILVKARKEDKEPRYLSPEEFQTVQKEIRDVGDYILEVLTQMGFHSGCRLGELYGVKETDVADSFIQVNRQLTCNFKFRTPKNNKKRKAFLMPGGKEWFDKWFKIPEEERLAYRKLDIARKFKAVCIKAFPTRVDKHCVFHDIRHSNAIELLRRGVPISWVAKSLGNSVVVCEEYYQGKSAKDELIIAMGNLLTKQEETEPKKE